MAEPSAQQHGGSRVLLVTGATGFIGSRLASLALSRGYTVRTLTRSDWAGVPAVPAGSRYFGSLPAHIPPAIMEGVDVVVHCAAMADGGERAVHAVNTLGTIHLAEQARRAGVQTFVFLSSQSARADALSAYGKTKYAAERALLEQDDLNVIILRPGLVTGFGSRGLFQRMCRTVEKSPIIPLLAGGRSIVQPIHVDDLCTAIFLCDQKAPELHGTILKLGDTVGASLAEFLQAIAIARLGKRRPTVPIPLKPVEIAVAAAQALRIPLPINGGNLKGMKIVEKMDTAADMARLGLHLRSLSDAVRNDGEPVPGPLSLNERATRVMLVGAGRIGLVHAITLSRLNGTTLAALVDRKSGATRLLRGMGLSAPAFRTLGEGIGRTNPDAAVIATPVSTHLALTRECVANGLAVMVEKPLAIREEQLVEFEQLMDDSSGRPVQVGYVMVRNPQVAYCLEQLAAGQYGEVKGFLGLTLLSLIQENGTRRWEVRKEVSGGGVLINAGGHVLSMIRAAFGEPQSVRAESVKLCSAEVEDSMAISFTYPDFSGTHYCSWSIDGYPRQENRLVIWTDQGQLILTGSVGVFVRNGGDVELTHQLEFDVGFNMAPDYAGAGFTTELLDLNHATRTGQPAPMNLEEAIRLERLLFQVYAAARQVETLTEHSSGRLPTVRGTRLISQRHHVEHASTEIRRVLDLRDLSKAHACAYLASADAPSGWDEYMVRPDQVRGLPAQWRTGEGLHVTVPDFLNQSRLLSTGRYRAVLQNMGAGGITAAGLACTPLVLTERGATLWVAAMGLLAAGLRSTPKQFSGGILLHGYLTDLALALGRLDVLEKMLVTCRRARPHARVGFHTNLAPEALNALWLLDTPVDEVSVLTSPSAPDAATRIAAMRRAAGHDKLRIIAEVGLAPAVVHRLAYQAPQHWAFGADAVLVGAEADADLFEQRQAELGDNWAKVFPGLGMPEGVL